MPAAALALFLDPAFIPRAAEAVLVVELVRPMVMADHESLVILAFDGGERLVDWVQVSDAACCSVRLPGGLLRRLGQAPQVSTLLLAHNHPSGEASPSAPDIALTRQLVQATALFGLDLTDHLILTDQGHFSFRAAGLL